MTLESNIQKTWLQEKLEREGWTFLGNYEEDFEAPRNDASSRLYRRRIGAREAAVLFSRSWKRISIGRGHSNLNGGNLNGRASVYQLFLYGREPKIDLAEDSTVIDYS